jgi:hypothetical protein
MMLQVLIDPKEDIIENEIYGGIQNQKNVCVGEALSAQV